MVNSGGVSSYIGIRLHSRYFAFVGLDRRFSEV